MYEVTSIIVNSDFEKLEMSLESIAYCLKKAFQYPKDTYVHIACPDHLVSVGTYCDDTVFLRAPIKIFNEENGFISVNYPSNTYRSSDFLEEESKLLTNVCLEVGNLLERKQIKEKEARIRKQMEHSDRLTILGEITAGIAHELNTPLTNIIGFTELLDEEIKKGPVHNDLNKIKENALFCREIVKKLMFFACEIPQQIQETALFPVLENVLNLLGPTFKEKEVSFDLLCPDKSIGIKADEIQLTQVLFNVIMNALYYAPKRSTITVTVQSTHKDVEICIGDQGKGISPKISDKIFEPFFTTKPVGDGSGLGLSVVHGIMNSHKGSISFKKNKPTGTIFKLAFPK